MIVRELIRLPEDSWKMKAQGMLNTESQTAYAISTVISCNKFQFNIQNVKAQALSDTNKRDLVYARYRVTVG